MAFISTLITFKQNQTKKNELGIVSVLTKFNALLDKNNNNREEPLLNLQKEKLNLYQPTNMT